MKKLPVIEHLSDKECELFLKVYAKHNRSMGLEERRKYTLADVVKVKRNVEERCLNVHFRNGDWWHYSVNGTWY